jgi:hypothetical protein
MGTLILLVSYLLTSIGVIGHVFVRRKMHVPPARAPLARRIGSQLADRQPGGDNGAGMRGST